MVLVVEGLPYFGAPHKAKALMRTLAQLEDSTLRLIGGAAMLLGLIILYMARGGIGY